MVLLGVVLLGLAAAVVLLLVDVELVVMKICY